MMKVIKHEIKRFLIAESLILTFFIILNLPFILIQTMFAYNYLNYLTYLFSIIVNLFLLNYYLIDDQTKKLLYFRSSLKKYQLIIGKILVVIFYSTFTLFFGVMMLNFKAGLISRIELLRLDLDHIHILFANKLLIENFYFINLILNMFYYSVLLYFLVNIVRIMKLRKLFLISLIFIGTVGFLLVNFFINYLNFKIPRLDFNKINERIPAMKLTLIEINFLSLPSLIVFFTIIIVLILILGKLKAKDLL